MDGKIKEIIKRISKADITQPVDKLGDVISDILFKNEESALFFNKDESKVFLLLTKNVKENKKQEEVLRLTEFVAILQGIERSGLIYVESSDTLHTCLFYQGKELFEQDQRPGIYRISDDAVLKYRNDVEVSLIVKGKELMCTVVILDQICLPLARLLCSYVLPTKSLKDYVKRGFKSKEEYSTQLGLRYSIISMTIAVVIAAITPILSVLTANRIGYSTIKQEQMDSLLKTSKPVYIVNHQDSSLQKCKGEGLQKTQKGNGNGK